MGTGASRSKKKTSPIKSSNNQNPLIQNYPQGETPQQSYRNVGEDVNVNEYRPSQPRINQGSQNYNQSVNTLNEMVRNRPGGESKKDVETARPSKYANSSKKLKSNSSIRGPSMVIEETFSDKIYFDEKELRRLKKKFALIDTNNKGEITPNQLGNLLELSTHCFKERIVQLAEDKLAAERKQAMSFDDFTRILSIFNNKCPVEAKIRYLFRVYDINGDNYVDERDVVEMLKMIFFVKEQDREVEFETILTNEEYVEGIARDIINTYDMNRDLRLDLSEFKNMLGEGDLETRMNIVF